MVDPCESTTSPSGDARPRRHWVTASPGRFAALLGGTLGVVRRRPAARAAPPVDLVQPGRATTARACQTRWTPTPTRGPPRRTNLVNLGTSIRPPLVSNLRHLEAGTRIHRRDGRRGVHRGKIAALSPLAIRRSSERFPIPQITCLGRKHVHIRYCSPLTAHRVRHLGPRKRGRRRGLCRRSPRNPRRPRKRAATSETARSGTVTVGPARW